MSRMLAALRQIEQRTGKIAPERAPLAARAPAPAAALASAPPSRAASAAMVDAASPAIDSMLAAVAGPVVKTVVPPATKSVPLVAEPVDKKSGKPPAASRKAITLPVSNLERQSVYRKLCG